MKTRKIFVGDTIDTANGYFYIESIGVNGVVVTEYEFVSEDIGAAWDPITDIRKVNTVNLTFSDLARVLKDNDINGSNYHITYDLTEPLNY